MKAVVVHKFGGPEVLSIEEQPDPSPGTGQVLIDNKAAGVNPVDAYIRAGQYARLPSLPYIPGWDGAGVVAEVGSGVSDFKKGDRVYFSGTSAGRSAGAYATRVVCSAHQVHALPARLSFAQGAAIGVPYATAHRALFGRAQVKSGETVLIHGASGSVGLAATQLAKAAGCTVIGTAGSDPGLALVKQQGAKHAVKHGTPDAAKEILALTDGKGVNAIIEMLANVNLDTDLGLLAVSGRVVVVGNRGRVEIDARQTMAKESAILGMTLWHLTDEQLSGLQDQMASGFADGTLNPVVGSEVPITEAGAAHSKVFGGATTGKIVLLLS
ncbi:MAG TPA: NADPH:quinone reductase [Gemmatimonadales bacterium]|nr:NADPH:quinone reductase [Gemmatimonadales bacterium]